MTDQADLPGGRDEASVRHGVTSIKMLDFPEPLRDSPELYVGRISNGSGLHRLVQEAVGNAIVEVLAGYATRLEVILKADNSVTVRDDGRGIPVGIDRRWGVSVPEGLMTIFFFGPFDDNPYWQRSLDFTVVNALSSRLKLTVWRDDKEHVVDFVEGKAVAPLDVVGEAAGGRGTEVTFLASREIFRKVDYDLAVVMRPLREVAFLNPGVTIVVSDQRQGRATREEMHYPGGVEDFVRYLGRDTRPIMPTPVVARALVDRTFVEVALWWSDSDQEKVRCFGNGFPQCESGTHRIGFLRMLRGRIKSVVSRMSHSAEGPCDTGVRLSQVPFIGRDCSAGLIAVVSVKMPDPEFRYNGVRLMSPELRPVVERAIGAALETWFAEHPGPAMIVVDKIIEAATIRNAAESRRAGSPGIT